MYHYYTNTNDLLVLVRRRRSAYTALSRHLHPFPIYEGPRSRQLMMPMLLIDLQLNCEEVCPLKTTMLHEVPQISPEMKKVSDVQHVGAQETT